MFGRRRTPTFGRGYQDASADLFLHLLSYVALSSVKLGLDVSEPRCKPVPRTEGGGGCDAGL
jgi:hypothetical protein